MRPRFFRRHLNATLDIVSAPIKPAKEKDMTSSTPAPVRSYGFGTVVHLPYNETIERTRDALRAQGFGVLTEIDVKATMKAKLDADFRPYIIFGACNPPLAHRALSADLGIGLLLPCNVIVYDNLDGTSTVEAMDPQAALSLVGDNRDIAEVAREAAARLRAALDSINK
jgi:uncharacterized protein (DUF302 family)